MLRSKLKARPVLKVKWSTFDKIIEAITFILLILLWSFVVFNYAEFPDRIVTHFNFQGSADAYRSKASIWQLPIVASFLYALLTTVNNYPQIFNYLEEITIENAEKQYTTATRMIRIIKLIVVIVFIILTVSSIPQDSSSMS